MIMAIQVYGIPTCSTYKKAFKWLEDNSTDYEFENLGLRRIQSDTKLRSKILVWAGRGTGGREQGEKCTTFGCNLV
jgi:hypothetical protein